jgi:hypothetical protein
VKVRASWHTFQVLTKRSGDARPLKLEARVCGPHPNIWWGVSVEDHHYGGPRIAELREAKAAVRFLSVEPPGNELDHRGWESGPGARPMREAWVVELRDQCRCALFHFSSSNGRRPEGTHRKEARGRSRIPVLTPTQRRSAIHTRAKHEILRSTYKPGRPFWQVGGSPSWCTSMASQVPVGMQEARMDLPSSVSSRCPGHRFCPRSSGASLDIQIRRRKCQLHGPIVAPVFPQGNGQTKQAASKNPGPYQAGITLDSSVKRLYLRRFF